MTSSCYTTKNWRMLSKWLFSLPLCLWGWLLMSIPAAEWSWSYCRNLFIPWVRMNPLGGNWRKLMTLFAVSWVSTACEWKIQLSLWPTPSDRTFSSSSLPKQTLCFSVKWRTQLLKLLTLSISLSSPGRGLRFLATQRVCQWPVSYSSIWMCTF